jgi:hypothetical protein
MATTAPPPITPENFNFETIQDLLYSNEVNVVDPLTSKPVNIKNNDMFSRAKNFVDSKKLQIEELKIKNSLSSNSIFFGRILNDKIKRKEKQKCSEILGFTLRQLSVNELTKFKLDTTKKYYIIDGMKCESLAAIIGFKVGDIIIGMYNTNNFTKQLFEYVDEDALYNLNGNLLDNTKTILYISISVIRYNNNLELETRSIFPIDEKYINNSNILNHTKRFIIPYLNSKKNTIIKFGSLNFKDYISDLTDFTQLGGAKPKPKPKPPLTTFMTPPSRRAEPLGSSFMTPPSRKAEPLGSSFMTPPSRRAEPLGSSFMTLPSVKSSRRSPPVLPFVIMSPSPKKTKFTGFPIMPKAKLSVPSFEPPPPSLQLNVGILPLPPNDSTVSPQRILLMNLYLNEIFNRIILIYKKKKNNPSWNDFKIKSMLTPIAIYNSNVSRDRFTLPTFNEIKNTDKKIISKLNSILDKKIKFVSCTTVGGKGNRNKTNYILKKKHSTIKKKIRNIKNKKSLKSKINKKIKKCIKKKCIKKFMNFKQKEAEARQQKNKHRIKKILKSKISEKINKFKLNMYNKNKNHTRKHYN